MSTKENPQQTREYSIYVSSTKQRITVTKKV